MAGGGYPVAWRGASIPLAPPAGAFTPAGRVGQVPGTFPNLKPANANAPLPRLPGVPAAFRIGARFLPLIGYGLLLWELWELYQRLADELGSQPAGQGYSQTLNCPPHVKVQEKYASNVSGQSACELQFFWNAATEIVPGQSYPLVTYLTRGNVGAFLGWIEKQWVRVEPGAPFWPSGRSLPLRRSPYELPRPWYAPFPQILPEAAPPPLDPVPAPRPVPVRFVPYLPRRSPSGEPIRGPRPVRPVPEWPFIPGEEIEPVPGFDPIPNPVPVPVPVPSPVPGPAPAPDAPPGRSPARWPASQIEWAPGRAPRVTRRPHVRRPPRKDERERKQVLNVDRRHIVARAMNAASETCDVVDALYDALPEATRRAYERETWKAPSWWNHRGKGMNVPCQAKAAAVWKYLDQLDWGDAMYNLAYNQIVDFGFGKAGQAAGKVGRDIGRPVGLGTGPAL